MITVRITDTADGVEIFASGHAGFAPAGQDIVCAGVSALVFGTMAYLSDTANAQRAAGRAAVCQPDRGTDWVWIMTRGYSDGMDRHAARQLAAGVRMMAEAYPQNVRLLRQSVGAQASATG